jgi:hypothetical protein
MFFFVSGAFIASAGGVFAYTYGVDTYGSVDTNPFGLSHTHYSLACQNPSYGVAIPSVISGNPIMSSFPFFVPYSSIMTNSTYQCTALSLISTSSPQTIYLMGFNATTSSPSYNSAEATETITLHCTKYVCSDILGVTFNPVNVTLPTFTSNNGFTTTTPAVCATSVCSISDLSGCIKEGICWAFVPPTGSTPDWNDLKIAVQNKPPFGYVSALTAGIAGINASDTPAYVIMSSQTKTDFSGLFDPIRNAITVIIYFAGLVWLYIRAKNLTV